MLKLSAAQLKEQIASGVMNKKPIWIDLGGGTGKFVIRLSKRGFLNCIVQAGISKP
jgi:betaine lipid synthase